MLTFVMIEDDGDDMLLCTRAHIATDDKDADTKRLHGRSRKGVGDDEDDEDDDDEEEEDANNNAIYVKRLQ